MDVSMGACRTEARVLGPQTEQEAALTMEAEAGATRPQAGAAGATGTGSTRSLQREPGPARSPVLARYWPDTDCGFGPPKLQRHEFPLC